MAFANGFCEYGLFLILIHTSTHPHIQLWIVLELLDGGSLTDCLGVRVEWPESHIAYVCQQVRRTRELGTMELETMEVLHRTPPYSTNQGNAGGGCTSMTSTIAYLSLRYLSSPAYACDGALQLLRTSPRTQWVASFVTKLPLRSWVMQSMDHAAPCHMLYAMPMSRSV